MPTSDHNTIDTILKIVSPLAPKRIFEIGPGYGKYAHLLREMLDVCNGRRWGQFVTTIDCCEIFPDYITDLHRLLYDNIKIDDARNADIAGYDLVLAIDVIEHLQFDTVAPFIERLVRNNRYVLIVVPYVVSQQGAIFDNRAETHVSQFNYAYFRRFGHHAFFPSDSLVALLSREPIPDHWRKDRKRALRRAIQSYFPNLYARARDHKHHNRFAVGPIV